MDSLSPKSSQTFAEVGSRIALLTPYTGGNLGDAAIQDAVIANLRLHLPSSQFSGITLNNENFVERHGANAFPLCATNTRFYAMSHRAIAGQAAPQPPQTGNRLSLLGRLKDTLKQVPGLLAFWKNLRRWALIIPQELLHMIRGYRFLRHQDILIVSGGGQLDEGWGGPWGHPFALCKWCLLARLARVPSAFVSVGAGKIKSPLCRLFLSLALRLASYRSYRDENAKKVAASLFNAVAKDPVVPDLAFSLPDLTWPANAGLRLLSGNRTIVAISPIAYAKPGSWPFSDSALHERYLEQMAKILSQLAKRDCFLVMVWSSLGDDESVIPEILRRLDDVAGEKLSHQVHLPKISTWQDFSSVLREVDFLVASRLHSTILGFVSQRPALAISFNPKVDQLMKFLNQTDYLFQINNFVAEDVISAFDRLKLSKESVSEQLGASRQEILHDLNRQYDAVVQLTMAGRDHRIEGRLHSFPAFTQS